MKPMTRQMWLPATIALALLVAGCGIGQQVISKADVEQGSKDALTKTVGKTPEAITCPKDLDATVGASERCVLTAGEGSTIGMTVTIKSVDGSRADFGVVVDNLPQPSGPPAAP